MFLEVYWLTGVTTTRCRGVIMFIYLSEVRRLEGETLGVNLKKKQPG